MGPDSAPSNDTAPGSDFSAGAGLSAPAADPGVSDGDSSPQPAVFDVPVGDVPSSTPPSAAGSLAGDDQDSDGTSIIDDPTAEAQPPAQPVDGASIFGGIAPDQLRNSINQIEKSLKAALQGGAPAPQAPAAPAPAASGRSPASPGSDPFAPLQQFLEAEYPGSAEHFKPLIEAARASSQMAEQLKSLSETADTYRKQQAEERELTVHRWFDSLKLGRLFGNSRRGSVDDKALARRNFILDKALVVQHLAKHQGHRLTITEALEEARDLYIKSGGAKGQPQAPRRQSATAGMSRAGHVGGPMAGGRAGPEANKQRAIAELEEEFSEILGPNK